MQHILGTHDKTTQKTRSSDYDISLLFFGIFIVIETAIISIVVVISYLNEFSLLLPMLKW